MKYPSTASNILKDEDISNYNSTLSLYEKEIICVDEDGNKFRKSIDSLDNFNNILKENNYHFIFYYDKEKMKIPIYDNEKFYNLMTSEIIYNSSTYINTITEKQFYSQLNSYANYAKSELYLDKFFINNHYFYPYHLDNYEYIFFKKCEISLENIRESSINIFEFFSKKGVGMTTLLYIYFSYSNFRKKESGEFKPFIIFDCEKISKISN